MRPVTDDFAKEMSAFADSLASAKALKQIKPSLKKATHNIKNAAAKDFKSSKYFKGVTPAVSYDILQDTVTTFESEIGPESGAGSPGQLANIAYFGASRGGGGTVRPIEYALADEVPALEDFILRGFDSLFKEL